MKFLERLSFRRQLTLAAAATSGLALLLVAAVLLPRELVTSQRELEGDLASLAEVIGTNSTAALAFADGRAARENLAALRGKPSILVARLFLADGRPLAEYVNPEAGHPALPARPEASGFRTVDRDLVLFHPVAMEGETLGVLYLRCSREAMRLRTAQYLLTLGLTLLGALMLASFLAARVNVALSRPIVALTTAARDVSTHQDYSVRVHDAATPELATLTSAFNGMIEQIQRQDADLRAARDELGERVHERVLELRASQEQLRAVVEHSTNVFFTHTPEDVVTYVSPQCRTLLDCDPAEVLASPTMRWLTDHPANRKAIASKKAAFRTGLRQPPYELEMRGATGRIVWVEVSETPVLQDGHCTMIVGALADITERKRAEAEKASLEDQLRQAQKMEAVGRLAGGVAHDFNNILGVILGYGEQLQRRIQDPVLTGKVQQILQASERAAALTRQLLAFSRRQVVDPKVLDLSAIVSEMEKMLRRLIGEDVSLSVAAVSDLGAVRADPGQIEQVLMNLAVNARDAMPDGGGLTIALENVELAARPGLTLPAGPYVMLSVTDTGCGMSSDVVAHLFEPFFTTKVQGKGTGLGLATVYGIVQQSSGAIEVETAEGRGTTFRIYLPRLDAPISEGLGRPARAALRRGTGTILVVEDDDILRPLVSLMLCDAGYDVLEASGGAEALRVAEAHGARIDGLLTDVVMPHMGGRDLANRLRSRTPRLAVVYMTGYTDDFITKQVLEPEAQVLQKPFNVSLLLDTMAEALSTAESAATASGRG